MKFIVLVEGNTEKQTAAEFLKRWLDPTVATGKCPQLDRMLNEMLRLAKAAGL